MTTLVTGAAGFINILEGCRHSGVEHLVYASSEGVRRFVGWYNEFYRA